MNTSHRTLLSTICFIGLGGMPHERAVFFAPEGAAATGGGGGSAAPAGGASSGGAAPAAAPSGGAPPPATGNANAAVPPRQQVPPPSTPQKPTREPFKIKHKHKLAGDDGAERELELDLDLSEHLASYKRKVKADGRELDVSLDEAFDTYPLNKGAQNRLREAHEIRTQAEGEMRRVERVAEMLKSPQEARDLLRRSLGPEKFREMVYEVVAEELAYEKMTPQERTTHDARQKADQDARKRDRDLQQREGALTKREQEHRNQTAQRRSEELVKEWTPALEAAGVPQTDASIREMATIIGEARRLNYQMSPAEAAREMRTRLDVLLGEVVKKGDPERVRALLGDEGAEKIRQLEVKRLEEQPGRVISTPTTQNTPPPSGNTRQRVPGSLEEMRREMRQDAIAEEQKRMERYGR